MIEIKEEFKYRLEKALAEKDIKPAELAKATGISEATISQYRSGYSKPKYNRLALIANTLGVNPAWLMGIDVPMFPRNNEEIARKDASHMIKYMQLTPSQQKTVDDLIDYLLSVK